MLAADMMDNLLQKLEPQRRRRLSFPRRIARFGAVLGLIGAAHGVSARPVPPPAAPPPYARLADLAVGAELVAHIKVTKVAVLDASRSSGLAPGQRRLYLEAKTLGLLAGTPLGEKVRFLIDVPLDAKGKVPSYKNREFIVAAARAPGRPGDLTLMGPQATLDWTPEVDRRVRAILAEAVHANAPPAITGVREASFVPGNLAGEGETQIFLSTAAGMPATLAALHRPGQPVQWGVTWGELVDPTAAPPAKDSLAWYRLACSLPAELPSAALLGEDQPGRATAQADYAKILADLGPCVRQ